jgi:hypothetical protein
VEFQQGPEQSEEGDMLTTTAHAVPGKTAPPAEAAAESFRERRAYRRHRLLRAIACHVVSLTHRVFCAARVLDISQAGIGLLISRSLPAGAEVTVTLHDLLRGEHLQFALTVVHCDRLPSGAYYLGGRFNPELEGEDLEPFLGRLVPPA